MDDGPGEPDMPPDGGEHSHEQMTRDEFIQAMQSDIDPMKYAGEGWFDTSEYARKDDLGDPFVRGDIGHEGEYYPPPDPKKPKRYLR